MILSSVAAAVSAKRAGAGRVLLLEKSVLLGGLATIGLIAWYEPICDGNGKKLIYGMASELVQLSQKYGPSRYPEEWKNHPDSADTKKRYAGHSPAPKIKKPLPTLAGRGFCILRVYPIEYK